MKNDVRERSGTDKPNCHRGRHLAMAGSAITHVLGQRGNNMHADPVS